MAAPNNKPTLEAIVTRYRREVGRGDASTNTELEIRLQELPYAAFAAIYETLAARGEGQLTQVVSAIMNVRRGADQGRDADGASRSARPMRIREIHFTNGARVSEQYVRKEQLTLPFRVTTPSGVAYIVALASEAPDQAPSMDTTAVIRIKARASFTIQVAGVSERPLTWRVDATVTRQISGADAASALKRITDQVFAPAASAVATLLPGLRLVGDTVEAEAARQLYRYEVEAEFLGPPDLRELLRPGDVTAAAEILLGLINPTHARDAALAAEVRRIAGHVGPPRGGELNLKRLLPPAIAITRAEYREIYPPTGMYLFDKTDGRRAVGGAHDGQGRVVSDTLLDGFPPTKDPRCAADTYLDGELVEVDGVPTLFAFDVIAVAGETVVDEPFEARIGRLAEGVAILCAAGVPAVAKVPEHVVGATPAELERSFRRVLEAKRPYAIDGVILVEPGKPYSKTRNLKHKEMKDNTIDFLTRRVPPSVLGQRPYVDLPGHKLHFLFVGINGALFEALGLQRCPGYAALFEQGAADQGGGRDERDGRGVYFPIQFAPSDAPLAYLYQHPDDSPLGPALDGKVAELRRVGEDAAGTPLWEATRIREDRRRDLQSKRYYGNDYHVAETIWLNYVDPFPLEQLWTGPGLDYFLRPKSGIYRAQTACISFVKEQRIASLKHSRWVVDVGAGKGQDLGRYLSAEVAHLIAIDQDRAALSELIRRRYGFADRGRGGRNERSDRERGERERGERGDSGRAGRRAATTIHVLVANANEPHKTTLSKLERFGFERNVADAVVCNLAVHYFCENIESVRNFVAFARGCVKVGGIAVLTVMAGEAVHAAFLAAKVPEGGTWDIFESPDDIAKYDGVPTAAPLSRKFSIRRLYAADTLEAAGQQIGVMLPFSDGSYYTEYLVNAKTFTAEFAARGFSVASAASVAKSIPEFNARNSAVASALTAGDKRYLGLYSELVFRRDN
jgi:SAM-dependent methyltransferase